MAWLMRLWTGVVHKVDMTRAPDAKVQVAVVPEEVVPYFEGAGWTMVPDGPSTRR